MKEEGKKFDSEKTMLQLIEPEFEEGIGNVLTLGAKKYGVDNWKNFTAADKTRFVGAMLRHLNAYRKGELYDPETGLSHLYHLCCEAMFADYFDRLESAKKKEEEELLEALSTPISFSWEISLDEEQAAFFKNLLDDDSLDDASAVSVVFGDGDIFDRK